MKTNSLKPAAKIETYMVQAILSASFEDLYVSAASEPEAIAIAKKLTTIKSKFVKFVI